MGKKYSKATEYYDEFIQGGFTKIPVIAKELVNQIGDEILDTLKGKI